MASIQPANQPTPLSFPRPVFAALSPHPFLQAHLTTKSNTAKATTPLRANGRSPQEFRIPGINTGSLTHCSGSAVVRLGNTAVVCGVRAEILKEQDIPGTGQYGVTLDRNEEEGEDYGDVEIGKEREEIEDLRLLVPNVELSTGSTPLLLPGNAPSTFAQTLVMRIRNLLLSTSLIRAKDLRILYTPPSNPDEPDTELEKKLKGYWVLYIDTLFISLDGNAFDAAWLAIVAAIRDTRIPHAYFDEEFETILCSDDPSEAHQLSLRGFPVPSTFAVFSGGGISGQEDEREDWVLSDPDAFEESVCRESICVVLDCSLGKGKSMKGYNAAVIKRIEKSGGGVVDKVVMRDLVRRATERWNIWEQAFNGKE